MFAILEICLKIDLSFKKSLKESLKKMAESEVKLTIGEDKVTTVDVTKGEEVDLKARDPEHLHDHIKVGHLETICKTQLNFDILIIIRTGDR